MDRTVAVGDCREALRRADMVVDDVPGFPLVKQAHYALYRGMAHACLGQVPSAWYWLARVEVMVQRISMILTGSHFTNYRMVMANLGNDPRINRPLLLATARRDMDREAARYRREQSAVLDFGGPE